jgi:hypothetical protein
VEAGCASISDPESCGVCGHSCLGGACLAGACEPVVLASGQGDSAFPGFQNDIGDPHTGPDRIAVDDAFVYWLNLRGEVMRVPIAGGTPERLATVAGMPLWIVLDDTWVYFSMLLGDVRRVPKNGGMPALVAPASSPRRSVVLDYLQPYPVELTLSGGEIFWADGSGVFACPVAGCAGAAPRVVVPGTSQILPFSFAIDGAGVEWASIEDQQPDADGGSFTPNDGLTYYSTGAAQFLGTAPTSSYYELHGAPSGVFALSAGLTGLVAVVHASQASFTVLASGDAVPPDPTGLALDDDYVYWCNGPRNAIDVAQRTASVGRCKKTGCVAPEILADGQVVPRAVAVTQDAVFWTTGDGRVMKLAKPANPPASTR